jgi:hypothetical protein
MIHTKILSISETRLNDIGNIGFGTVLIGQLKHRFQDKNYVLLNNDSLNELMNSGMPIPYKELLHIMIQYMQTSGFAAMQIVTN